MSVLEAVLCPVDAACFGAFVEVIFWNLTSTEGTEAIVTDTAAG